MDVQEQTNSDNAPLKALEDFYGITLLPWQREIVERMFAAPRHRRVIFHPHKRAGYRMAISAHEAGKSAKTTTVKKSKKSSTKSSKK